KFLSPGGLWLLIGVALLAILYVVSQIRRRYVVMFPNVDVVARAAPGHTLWRRHITAIAFLLALVAGVLAFARPVHQDEVAREQGTVILALDASMSMQATDVSPSRLVAAQRAAEGFIRLLPAKVRLGVVVFSGDASLVVSPTTDRAKAIHAVANV